MQTCTRCKIKDCHFASVKAIPIPCCMILGVLNHETKLEMSQLPETPTPTKSHPVTVVRRVYARLALLSCLSLGGQAWHPRQTMGTALTRTPLKEYAYKSLHAKHWQSKKKGKNPGVPECFATPRTYITICSTFVLRRPVWSIGALKRMQQNRSSISIFSSTQWHQ